MDKLKMHIHSIEHILYLVEINTRIIYVHMYYVCNKSTYA